MENFPAVLGLMFQHLFVFVLVSVLLTLLMCYAIQAVADKLGLAHSWMAWAPLLQIYLLIKSGGASFPHFLLLLLAAVPVTLAGTALGPLGFVLMLGYLAYILTFFVRIFWNTAEQRGLPGWLGIVAMLPAVGPFAYLYIAFHDGPVAPSKVGMLLGALFFVLPAIPQMEDARRMKELGLDFEKMASSGEGDPEAMARRMQSMLETMETGKSSEPGGDPEELSRAPSELEALPASFACPEGSRERGAAPPAGRERWCERNGVRHGGYASWYSGGRLRETGRYREGERTGVWTRWFPSGGKKTQAEFADDREHGLVLTWDELGRPTQAARFREGEPAGG